MRVWRKFWLALEEVFASFPCIENRKNTFPRNPQQLIGAKMYLIHGQLILLNLKFLLLTQLNWGLREVLK